MTKWRLIDLGIIDPVEYVSIKELLLTALERELIPNTLCFSIPKRHVWMGPTTNMRRRVNLEYCQKEGIPIIRDFSGGSGAAIHDEDSFAYDLAAREMIPDMECVLKSLQGMGLDAHKKERSNDILVAGKKISGGMGRFQPNGIYVAGGGVIIDFNYDLCEKALLTPPDLFVDKEAKSHTEWVTTLKTQLGREVTYEEVGALLKETFESFLQIEFDVATHLTVAEEQILEELQVKYRSDEWLRTGRWSPVKDYGLR